MPALGEHSLHKHEVSEDTYSFTYPLASRRGGTQVALPGRLSDYLHHSGGHANWENQLNFSAQDWGLVTWDGKDGAPGTVLYLATLDGRLQYSTPEHARKFGMTRGVGRRLLPPIKSFPGVPVEGVKV